MTIAYALLIEHTSPYSLYDNSHFKPSLKSQYNIWYYLSNVSKDPPLNNNGLCDLIDIHEKINQTPMERPVRVYCSNMCRAMMTAMILFPEGGEDGLIHIVPWIHEHGGWCNELGTFGKITGFQGAERLLTKTLRNPRDFEELPKLVGNINQLYCSDDIEYIERIIGNNYSSEKLRNHKITANLKIHPSIDKISQLEEPDPTKFMEVIVKPELPKGKQNISVVSHGYTMRSGCKSYEEACDGWCNYFASVKPRNKTTYTENLDTSLGNDGNVENGAYLEAELVRKKPLGKNLKQIKEKQMKLLFTKKEISEMSTEFTSQQSSLQQPKPKPEGFLDELTLFADQIRHEIVGSTEKIQRNKDNKEPISVEYKRPGIKEEKFLKKLLKQHKKLSGSDADIFLELISILVMHLLYPWIYFSIGDKSDFQYKTLIKDFCNPDNFKRSMKRLTKIKKDKLLPEKLLKMFQPYLN
jgi:hypothetical protein